MSNKSINSNYVFFSDHLLQEFFKSVRDEEEENDSREKADLNKLKDKYKGKGENFPLLSLSRFFKIQDSY
jgi:hypothetical protein